MILKTKPILYSKWWRLIKQLLPTPLLGKLRACSQRQAVAAASMSVRRVKLWNDVGCKVLHINLFTAVLVTLIIQHGSSSHIEGGGEGTSCREREGKHNGGKKRFVHI